MEEGHRAVARPRELRADPRRELGIAAAPDRDEDAPGPRRRAFDDGEIAGGISQHLLDRETEDVPARPAPADEEDLGALGRRGFADRVPPAARHGHERAHAPAGRDLGRQELERAAELLRLRLGRRQGDVLGHLDDGGEDDVVLAREGEAGLDDRAVALDVGDGDEGLHGRPASTTGATRSAITRGHASARAPERRRAAGVSSTPTTASAMTSPEASAGT